MRVRLTLIALAMLAWVDAATAQPVGIGDFFGSWRCEHLDVDGAAPEGIAARDFDLTIVEHGRGFKLKSMFFARAPDPDNPMARHPLDAGFAPSRGPGVYAFEPTEGSLLSSLFADPSTGNPLEGDTLLWARLADDTLHVYGLAITEDGGFSLDHYQGRLEGDQLFVRYQVRLENDRTVTVDGRLSRAKG